MSAVSQSPHASDAALDIRRVAGRIGAEIRGVALSGALEAGREAFGRRLDGLVPHPTVPPLAGKAGILDIDGRRGRARVTEAREAA